MWQVDPITTGWGSRGELKAIDTSLTTADVSSTASLLCINPCGQGSDIGQRVGRQIVMKSLQIRGFFNPNGANSGDIVFWSVVYDRQPNAALCGWTDVYTTSAAYPQLRNLNNRKRFKVLGSGYITIPATTSIDAKYIPFEFYRKLNHPVEFNATNGGTIADITTGSLVWMVRATAALGADDVAFNGSSRVRYSDT